MSPCKWGAGFRELHGIGTPKQDLCDSVHGSQGSPTGEVTLNSAEKGDRNSLGGHVGDFWMGRTVHAKTQRFLVGKNEKWDGLGTESEVRGEDSLVRACGLFSMGKFLASPSLAPRDLIFS